MPMHIQSGGIYFDSADLGGMTSEIMDDYEEGTFALYGQGAGDGGIVTMHTSYDLGWYTKVGRICQNQGFVSSSSGTFTGSLKFPLSHTVATGEGAVASCHAEPYRLNWPDATRGQISGLCAAGNAYFTIICSQDDGETFTIATAWVTSSSAMRWQFVFTAAH